MRSFDIVDRLKRRPGIEWAVLDEEVRIYEIPGRMARKRMIFIRARSERRKLVCARDHLKRFEM
jgi:hypothetical protein